jgi:hypothetical protein
VPTRLRVLPLLVTVFVLAVGMSECKKPTPAAEAAPDAGAVAQPAPSDQGEGPAACKRVAQVKENCGGDKPCPPSQLDDFQKCAEYLRQAGLEKNPY